jgi:hypothetical protein
MEDRRLTEVLVRDHRADEQRPVWTAGRIYVLSRFEVDMVSQSAQGCRMCKPIRIILILCMVSIATILCSCRERKVGTVCRAGEHKIVILETFQGITTERTSNVEGMPDGTVVFTYHSSNLNMDVRLEDGVLTVDGVKYVIPKKDDSITIRDRCVEVNDQPATRIPDRGGGK